MTKIFKHLAKHWAACLVIIALLLVQAYGDLTLPDYTSKLWIPASNSPALRTLCQK